MKFYALLCAVLAICMLILPALALSTVAEHTSSAVSTAQISERNSDPSKIAIYLKDEGKKIELDMNEYLVGAVAAEMPAEYHDEALKAQAIASHTYALYRQSREQLSSTPTLSGADLSDDPELYQGYWDQETRKNRWGADFETNEQKIRSVVSEVQDLILTYDNEPIDAVFFSMSAGRTESAANVFGVDLPYLQSVTSDADTLSPVCSKTVYYSDEEFLNRLQKIEMIEPVSKLTDDCIGERIVRESGTVKSVTLCGNTVSGQQIREAFGLNSTAFTIEQNDSGFAIRTMGNGHFVGMSQYGAEQMARDGATFRQILHHYYTGVTLSDE